METVFTTHIGKIFTLWDGLLGNADGADASLNGVSDPCERGELVPYEDVGLNNVPLVPELRLPFVAASFCGFLWSTYDSIPTFHCFVRAAVFLHARTVICIFPIGLYSLRIVFLSFSEVMLCSFVVLASWSVMHDLVRALPLLQANESLLLPRVCQRVLLGCLHICRNTFQFLSVLYKLCAESLRQTTTSSGLSVFPCQLHTQLCVHLLS